MNGMRELIDDYFSNPKAKQHNVVRAIFAYTASRTINSSPFVIAKDQLNSIQPKLNISTPNVSTDFLFSV